MCSLFIHDVLYLGEYYDITYFSNHTSLLNLTNISKWTTENWTGNFNQWKKSKKILAKMGFDLLTSSLQALHKGDGALSAKEYAMHRDRHLLKGWLTQLVKVQGL